MDQLPEEVRVHVFGRRGAHLDLGDGNQHLVADDFHFVGGVFVRDTLLKMDFCLFCRSIFIFLKTHHQLLLLSQSLLAQEHNRRFEDKAHGVQFQAFFDLAQKVRDVQPLNAAVIQ
jgi:hypothetical protein